MSAHDINPDTWATIGVALQRLSGISVATIQAWVRGGSVRVRTLGCGTDVVSLRDVRRHAQWTIAEKKGRPLRAKAAFLANSQKMSDSA